ncbi:MAG: hypothetical protein ABIS47_10825, partial [Acidimicrobiales bacterium]
MTAPEPPRHAPDAGLPGAGLPAEGLPADGQPADAMPDAGLPTGDIPTGGLPDAGLPTGISAEDLLPDDPLDAAASAVVDGEATPEEAALVAASPQGAARLAGLRAVSEAVGRPGREQDPPAEARALAAALAAFDAAGTEALAGGNGPDRPGEHEAT